MKPNRRQLIQSAALAPVLGVREAASGEVRQHLGKPTLFVRGQAQYPAFYALTDCPGGRWSFDEAPAQSIGAFVRAGFRLFQLDLFLEDCWTGENEFSIEPARRQIRGVTAHAGDASVVLRWHVNAPPWWLEAHQSERTGYSNGELETIARTQPKRILQDDLRRTPRASFASEAWMAAARAKTGELLQALAGTPEGDALIGVHLACGVYGEWHYWGFMRNEPDTSRPMQLRFDAWRQARLKPPTPVPSTAERAELDNGVLREAVSDYLRCQQELVAERILDLCRIVKWNWPRPILTGAFYGYFFSMFERQATGGHLELQRVLASPHIDYLSAPQAYGATFRDAGGSGLSRALVESVRAHGKLFLDEMDQTPSWRWRNDVDTAFELTDVAGDIAILRRNVVSSYTRGGGLWYYDFGPSNHSGWWLDTRLMAEIKRLRELLAAYHQRPYQAAADVLLVYSTDVYYRVRSHIVAGQSFGEDRSAREAWAAGASIETIHIDDLARIDLRRFRAAVFPNAFHLSEAQQGLIEAHVKPAGVKTLMVTDPAQSPGTVDYRRFFESAGAHLYTAAGDIVYAGGGIVLIHTKAGGARQIRLRSGRTLELTLAERSTVLVDAESGARLL